MSIRISPFLLPEKRIEKVLLVYLLDHFLYLFLFTVILATFADTQQSIHFMTLVQVRKISVHYLINIEPVEPAARFNDSTNLPVALRISALLIK